MSLGTGVWVIWVNRSRGMASGVFFKLYRYGPSLTTRSISCIPENDRLQAGSRLVRACLPVTSSGRTCVILHVAITQLPSGYTHPIS
jgi:hypothetical protein